MVEFKSSRVCAMQMGNDDGILRRTRRFKNSCDRKNNFVLDHQNQARPECTGHPARSATSHGGLCASFPSVCLSRSLRLPGQVWRDEGGTERARAREEAEKQAAVESIRRARREASALQFQEQVGQAGRITKSAGRVAQVTTCGEFARFLSNALCRRLQRIDCPWLVMIENRGDTSAEIVLSGFVENGQGFP